MAERSERAIPGMGFAVGGLAACGAVTFTNPWEVVKTRLQLQGELMSKQELISSDKGSGRVYRGIFDAFGKIARNEGLRGLQRGLAPAYMYQLTMNGVRFGGYDSLKAVMTKFISPEDYRAGRLNSLANILSGAMAGITGAALGSPFFLIKTRMQAHTEANPNRRYHYTGVFNAIKLIVKADGLRGLFGGMEAAMIRTGVGSAIQMATYDRCRHLAVEYGVSDNIAADFTAALGSGLMVCVGMNPFDVVMTRMYNQSAQNSLYKSPLDCFLKTLRAEGPFGFYKGFGAHYFRIGPHTILCFVFLGQLRGLARSIGWL